MTARLVDWREVVQWILLIVGLIAVAVAVIYWCFFFAWYTVTQF